MAADTDSNNSSKMKKSPEPTPPLPASIDDIPPSEIRSGPLSSEEIQDIRSLISVAKHGSSSRDNGENTTAIENQPLTGRRVMVPVTSKAFYEGILKPPTKATGAVDDSTTTTDEVGVTAEDVAKEWVIVNKDGKMVEMTRGEADDFFMEKEQGMNKKKPEGSSLKKKGSKSPSIKKSTAKKQAGAAAAPDKSAFPLVEIRETCDVSGNILNSEVVNMSNTIKRLGDGLNNITDSNEGDGKQMGELIAQTLKEGEDDIIKNVHETSTTSHTEGEEQSQQQTLSKPKEEPISDEAYQAITTRLEELERLEEEDTTSKALNTKSSKRLQSGGWSKGFLNKKKNAHRNRKPSPRNKSEEKGARVSFSGQKSSEIPAFTGGAEQKSRVSFSTSDSEIDESDHAREKTPRVSFTTADSQIEIAQALEKKCRVSFSARDALTTEEWETASTASTASQTSISSAESGRKLRVSFTSSDNEIEDVYSALQTPPGSAPNSPKPTRVSFNTGDNTVKEIPRIGQMKVPSRRKFSAPSNVILGAGGVDNSDAVSDTDSEVSDTADPFGEGGMPFDDNVFKGVVTERNFAVASSARKQEAAAPPPKKKLSRFAQQRLERGM